MTDANLSPLAAWPAAWRRLVASLPALVLIGCGGSSGPGSTAAVSVSPQPAAVMTFVGAAATGAGIVNAPVSFKCLGSTQGTTIQASGTTTDTAQYRVAMPVGAKLPCVVRVVGVKGALHAAVDGSHTTKDVNITPLTDLQLSVASGIAAGLFFDTFGDALANKLDGITLASAQKEVADLFRPVVNLSGMQSFVTDTLVPAVAGKQAGNQVDQFLDQINAAMASNAKSLAQVTAIMLEQKLGAAAAKLLWAGPTTAPPPAAQAISFASLASQTLGSATPALSAMASSGLPVTFTSGTPAICTVNGSVLTLLAAGSCTVVANQAGNASYAVAADVARSFTVNAAPAPTPPPVTPAAQTITFISPATQTLGAATPALAASASSGLPVIFTSGSSLICITSGTSLVLLASGTCQITASQAGNTSFAAAPIVVRSFLVNAAPVITITTQTQTLSCPTGQTGSITQSRTVTTTDGVAVNGAWNTTSNTCVTPPPPRSCVSQALVWTVGANSCTATPPTTASGVAATTTDNTAPTTGSASFLCTDGNWGVATNTSCVTPVVVVTTETQTLSCPTGQTGSITQSRNVTTTDGVAVNGAWSTTSNTCVTPPPPRSCVSQALVWTLGANSCTATPPSTASGVAATTTDNTAPTTGSASFLCTNGNWGAPLNASCNAAPVLNALSTNQAARFLTQATFGPTGESVAALTGRPAEDWLTEQMSMPAAADYVDEMQRWFDKGSNYRPGNGGDNYTPGWLQHKYWSLAINAPDQLRRRVVHALLQIHVVSLEDSTLYDHGRSIGQYVDNLGKHAFGNYRNLLQDVALSPVMGMYLSHIRNQKANATTGRMPDENFAREVMQLFSIGLHQLNIDGTVKTGSNGKPLETYSNYDVIGLARVFTGWSWDMADGSNASTTFQWAGPGRYDTVGAARFDLKSMRVYPSFHETGAKSFLGVTIPAGTDGNASLRIALDTLFNHPNVGPFIGRQLIQRLVTSNPSPAYVQFVAQAFNNNGSGVRGDMAAVIRAVLLYSEARSEPTGQFGKLREPVLRVTQAVRALQASSLTGRWMMGWDERRNLLQAPLGSPSVFNFYRPGYVPPNTQIATLNMVAPEFQIANETTVVEWVNYSWALLQWGVAWTGSGVDVPLANRNKSDVTIDFTRTTTTLGQAAVTSDAAVVDQLNLLLFAGRMSTTLRGQILNAMQSQVGWNASTRLADRQKIAAFIALTSSEYLIER